MINIPEENRIEVVRTLRYYSLGNKKEATTLIIALHGFGQLAYYFIQKFKNLDKNYYVVAPEGMHRFYLKGNSGRVGASWMTKEARELDIKENSLALDSMFSEINKDHHFSKVILLGFSQGGATAARWFFHSQSKFNHLILWASVFPPDIEKPQLKSNKKNFFIIGTEDEFYNSEQQQNELINYQSNGFETIHFEGKHDIDFKILSDILKSIE